MEVTEKIKNGICILSLAGRLDANTSAGFQEQLLQIDLNKSKLMNAVFFSDLFSGQEFHSYNGKLDVDISGFQTMWLLAKII